MQTGREIACDESGYEGEKLVGGETDVFAHAGVSLSTATAADCVTELRRRIRSPALEYKANHLLREKNRRALEWLLGPDGPLRGRAGVHLTDKTFLLVHLLVRDDRRAHALYRAGRRTPDQDSWTEFLTCANDLMRAGGRGDLNSFHRAVDELRDGLTGEAREVLGPLRPTVGSLDPLVPAIVSTVTHWSTDGPVAVVHDRQTSLTAKRIAVLRARLGGRLTGLYLVDSRTDPRVQVADFLAGVARKVASDELSERGDTELVALLTPYVDPSSTWSDDRSWSQLRPVR